MRLANPYSTTILICLIVIVSAAFSYSQSGISTDERIALVERKIEGGTVRGDISRSEYSKLKTRLAVVKYKRAKLERVGTSEQAYKDLDHYLYGLESDTDRLLKGLKGR